MSKEEAMNNNKVCNMCGRIIRFDGDIPKEEYISVCKNWGYFSKKDGKTWNYIICESCNDKLIEGFAVPVEITDTTELL